MLKSHMINIKKRGYRKRIQFKFSRTEFKNSLRKSDKTSVKGDCAVGNVYTAP